MEIECLDTTKADGIRRYAEMAIKRAQHELEEQGQISGGCWGMFWVIVERVSCTGPYEREPPFRD